MISLFNTTEREEIITRLLSLTNNNERQWGKMTIEQMLLHCQMPLKLGVGEVKLKRNLIFILFGPMIKKSLMKNKPIGKNLPTHKDFIVTHNPKLNEEREKLIELINKFNDKKDHLETKHPIFGEMKSAHEWDVLITKHLDHHLRQFGA